MRMWGWRWGSCEDVGMEWAAVRMWEVEVGQL